MMSSRSLQRSLLVIALIAIALAVLPFVAPRQWIVLFTEICALLAIAMMWNLLAGFGGIVFMGFHVFIGIGGYILFVTANALGVMPFPLVIASAAGCAVFAFAVTPVLFRLTGAQLAIGTWVIAEVVRLIVYHTDFLGAGGGISLVAMRGVPRDIRLLLTFATAAVILVIALTTTLILMQGRFGLALRAIRDNPVAAEAMGVSIRRTQTIILVIAAAIAGAAGGAYYLIALQISPTSGFSINWTAAILFIVILGGIGTIEGPIVGAVVYFVLRETMSGTGATYFIVLGLLAIIVTLFAPKGIWGYVRTSTGIDVLPIRRRSPVSV
ncbi:branched-chain amino acid ABC transporter permease [Rhizobium leguminosarum]|uniref:branched-chain amino acid ABC transporter permease n=1 Tax=Rhizobium leguminosarum TaxID=384 RepID=UPI003ECE9BB0